MDKILRLLVAEQKADNRAKKVKPLITNPIKVKPFWKIKDTKKRAIFILHLAGFSDRKLDHFFGVHRFTVSTYICECYKEYPELKKT